MKIAVAGGTGTVGRHVVEAARARGHDVVVLTRSNGVDVTTGAGLAEALDGAGIDAVIDVTNVNTLSAAKTREFFGAATRHLLAAEEAAGIGHHVALSVVGIDGMDASYYAGKLLQERTIEASGVPHTIARVGQFFEFVDQVLASGSGPVAIVPRMLTRPVAAREVAEHLVDVAEAGPSGRATDLVGPRDEVLVDLVRRRLAHEGRRRRVLEVRLPGVYGRGLAAGKTRGAPPRIEGRTTFDEWLAGEDRAAM